MTIMLSRLFKTIILVTALSTSVGCGFVTSGQGGHPLSSNNVLLPSGEQPDFGRTKSPQQISVQSARVLPKPDLGVTPEVQVELNRFMTADRGTVVRVLEQHSDQFEKMGKVFEREGVPRELLSIAAVESGLDPAAMSPAGARGLWQFMRPTAQLYGLKVNWMQDERLDPKRSTLAAAKYLKDLFSSFQDWHLALAAYNAGSGAINRVMTRSGGTDFWELSRGGHLPGETRRFVPRVIALTLIVNDPDRYGFSAAKSVG
jgi:membrane-bound lytic murein transglycosylase D